MWALRGAPAEPGQPRSQLPSFCPWVLLTLLFWTKLAGSVETFSQGFEETQHTIPHFAFFFF